jgi:hypothetical protein
MGNDLTEREWHFFKTTVFSFEEIKSWRNYNFDELAKEKTIDICSRLGLNPSYIFKFITTHYDTNTRANPHCLPIN